MTANLTTHRAGLTQGCRIKCGWLFAALLALLSHPSHAELSARLSSPQVDETQTLELTIRSDSRDAQGAPDWSGLAEDFEVLTTRTSSQYRIINGNVQAWTEWIIALRPLRIGTLTIPALSYRGEQTQPLELRVVPLDPEVKRQMGNRVFFETSTEPESPYVQAQLIFTRRLLYTDGTQIYGEMPDTPKVENAVVISLGNATSSQVERDNQRYGMIEQRYALFPERSGELTIPGATVSGSVRMNVNGRLRRNGVRVIAEPVTLDVKPIPDSYPKNVPWLPATRVDLLEAWDTSPPVFALGEPLSQTLIVRADAATGSIIPPLDYSIPDSHFRSYPEQPELVDNQRADGLVGTRTRTWSLIPTTAGQVTLPLVELTWFDTQRNQVRVSRLPSRKVDIQGDPTAMTNPDTPASNEAIAEASPEQSVSAAERGVFGNAATLLIGLLLGLALWLLYPRLSHRFNWPKLEWRMPGSNRREACARLRDSIQNDDAPVIRVHLQNLLKILDQQQVPWPKNELAKMQELLAMASYAQIPVALDREALNTALDRLLTTETTEAGSSVLPQLYPTP